MEQREEFVWCQKYRPKTLVECILPRAVRETLRGVLAQKDIPNLLLTGKAGTGKTTVARALIYELGAECMTINASDENGIETLRVKIKEFASAMSFDGNNRKVVLLDEADYLSNATQPALRAFMEEFSRNCGFILTANFPQRIIQPLHSRCSLVDFKIPGAERVEVATQFANRACDILTQEKVTFNKRIVQQVVVNYFPDFRRVLNELQRFSATGMLSEAILSQLSDKDVAELFMAVKAKDFTTIRKWVANHEDVDAAAFFRMLLEQVPKKVTDDCLPQLIVMMADYSYKSGFVADPQLNMLACLVELMHDGSFKS